jgi:putative transposase
MTLGKTSSLRESAYRELFRAHIPEMDIDAIRLATNKSLGSEKFIEQFERRVGVAGKTAGHGGGRKSKAYKKSTTRPLESRRTSGRYPNIPSI